MEKKRLLPDEELQKFRAMLMSIAAEKVGIKIEDEEFERKFAELQAKLKKAQESSE